MRRDRRGNMAIRRGSACGDSEAIPTRRYGESACEGQPCASDLRRDCREVTVAGAAAVAAFWLVICTPLVSQSPPLQSKSSDEVPLQVIVVRSLEEARQILERLKKGEDFAGLAKDQSIDPTANSGGYIGKV